MKRTDRDGAVSEIIGFVLILAIVTLALSIYMTYSVPAQGRENEIAHMNYVGQEFSSIKNSVDSLVTLKRLNTPVSRSIGLGDQARQTQGGLSIPLLQPLPSGGTVAINQRNDALGITSVHSGTPSGTSLVVGDASTPVYLGISIPPNSPRSSQVIQVQDYTGRDLARATVSYTSDGTDGSVYLSVEKYNQTSPIPFYSNLPVFQNVTLGQGAVTMNLHDGRYGLDFSQAVFSVTDNPVMSFKPDMSLVPQDFAPRPMGSFEYSSQNRYWVDQDIIYQMDGIALSQSAGISSKVIPPLITINDNVPSVTVTTYWISPNSGTTLSLSGTGYVQVTNVVTSYVSHVCNRCDRIQLTITPDTTAGNPDQVRAYWKNVISAQLKPQYANLNPPEFQVSGNDLVVTITPKTGKTMVFTHNDVDLGFGIDTIFTL